jgi:hypothetical protein
VYECEERRARERETDREREREREVAAKVVMLTFGSKCGKEVTTPRRELIELV